MMMRVWKIAVLKKINTIMPDLSAIMLLSGVVSEDVLQQSLWQCL